MKKLIALCIVLALLASITACSAPASKDKLAMENVKVGFVHIADPSDGGYTYNHNLGTLKMQQNLGLRDDQIINKFNIPEGAETEVALKELIDAGCNIIFATSFGHETYVVAAAKENPNIQFCHASGYMAKDSGLKNVHNYFGKIYEARYLAGIAAGLKTKTNKLGFVGAFPYSEDISSFTGFYLGAKSVNPDVTMVVKYTNSWNDPNKEKQVAQALIDEGCDVLGQNPDSTATQTTAEANGVWAVGYNANMISAAPNASLTSPIWDWSIFLTQAVKAVVAGETIPVDFTGGLKEGVVGLSELNEAIIAPGTKEAINAAKEKIISGELKIFVGPITGEGVDYDGNPIKIELAEGQEFIEPQSAPSWNYIIPGITVSDN